VIRAADVSNTTVVVTGASGGIGEAVVRSLLDSGYRVVAIDAVPTPADLAANDRVLSCVCDVRDRNSIFEIIADSKSDESPFTGLVNCAGNHNVAPSIDLDLDAWHAVIDVHLTGTLIVSQAVARHMRKGGSIVNISSIAQDFGLPGRVAYCAAKAGLLGLTRTLAVEWADLGIRVNAIALGYVDTPMGMKGVTDRGAIERLHAMGRFASPSEVASVILFLLAEASSFITGEVIRVDGGYSVVKGTT
jgi:NAD(P)-dependent dehydrogenase (short-subunit alcohol dehydrogenase family)